MILAHIIGVVSFLDIGRDGKERLGKSVRYISKVVFDYVRGIP